VCVCVKVMQEEIRHNYRINWSINARENQTQIYN